MVTALVSASLCRHFGCKAGTDSVGKISGIFCGVSQVWRLDGFGLTFSRDDVEFTSILCTWM